VRVVRASNVGKIKAKEAKMGLITMVEVVLLPNESARDQRNTQMRLVRGRHGFREPSRSEGKFWRQHWAGASRGIMLETSGGKKQQDLRNSLVAVFLCRHNREKRALERTNVFEKKHAKAHLLKG